MASKRGATRKANEQVMREPLPWAGIRLWFGRLILILLGFATIFGGGQYAREHEILPIHHVRVMGEFVYADKPALIEAIKPYASGGLLTVDVQAISDAGKALPWIAKVEAKRSWPDTVLLTVYEHAVMARWGETQVINVAGEVFTPLEVAFPDDLVMLDGAEEIRTLISEEVGGLIKSFAEVGLTLQRLEMNKRRASKITFSNGIKLIVGQADNTRRIKRFKRAYSKLLQQYAAEIVVVDMRYSNGMVVGWKNGQKPNLDGAA
jgi:cell division protein FtsQ